MNVARTPSFFDYSPYLQGNAFVEVRGCVLLVVRREILSLTRPKLNIYRLQVQSVLTSDLGRKSLHCNFPSSPPNHIRTLSPRDQSVRFGDIASSIWHPQQLCPSAASRSVQALRSQSAHSSQSRCLRLSSQVPEVTVVSPVSWLFWRIIRISRLCGMYELLLRSPLAFTRNYTDHKPGRSASGTRFCTTSSHRIHLRPN